MSERAPGGEASSATREEGAGDDAFRMASVGKHAAIYAVGVFFERGLAVLMLPVYTRYLTPEDFGIMGLILMTLDVITIVAGAKLVQGVFRYYHTEETDEGRRGVVSTSAIALVATYSVVALGCFLASELLSLAVFESAEHAWLIRIASGTMMAEALVIVPIAYVRVMDYSKFFVTTNAIRLIGVVVLNVFFLVGLGWGVEALFVSGLITQGLLGIYMNVWLVRRVGLAFHGSTLRRLVRYSAPMVGSQFASFIYMFGDRYVLQRAAGEAAVGLYHIAYRLSALLPIASNRPLMIVWGPKRFAIAKRDDRDGILSRGHLYQTLLIFVGLVGLTVFAEDIVRILTVEEFYGAAKIVPVLALSWVFQLWALNQDLGILISERTGFLLLCDWLAAGVAVGGYVLLIPPFGAMGAAWATVIAFAFRWAIIYGISQRLWHVRYEWRSVAVVGAISGVAVAVSYVVSYDSLFVSIAANSLIMALYGAALWRSGVLTRWERERIATVAGNVLRSVWHRTTRR